MTGTTDMTILGITLVATVANLFGSLIAYGVGSVGGRPLLEKYGKYILISHSKLDLADKWFEKYRYEAVLISRLLPIIRTFISLPAGIAHMDIKKFVIYTVLGSLPWCFALGYFRISIRSTMGINQKLFSLIRYTCWNWNCSIYYLFNLQIQV